MREQITCRQSGEAIPKVKTVDNNPTSDSEKLYCRRTSGTSSGKSCRSIALMTYEARSKPNIAMAARRGACFGAVTAVSVWICSGSRASIATFLDDAGLIYQNGDRYTKGTARRSRN